MTDSNNDNKVSVKNPKLRNWCFTLNNPTSMPNKEKDDDWWDNLEDLRYGICQLEIGEETGTPHLQGYLEFTRPVYFTEMKEMLGKGVYLTGRDGPRVKARDYCRKEETRKDGPWEYGEWKQERGKRNDLDDIKKEMDKGATADDMAMTYFKTWARSHVALEKYEQIIRSKRKRQQATDIIAVVGQPKGGKTTYIQKTFPDAFWQPNSKWWDRYQGQDVVVLDEYVGWIPYHELLRFGDGTQLKLEVKHGHTTFLAGKLIIISNKMPWRWYNYDEQHLDRRALFRRIKEIWFFPEKETKQHLVYTSMYQFIIDFRDKYGGGDMVEANDVYAAADLEGVKVGPQNRGEAMEQ